MSAELVARITDYLCKGGFWNPELMEHDKVRQLLIDCRSAIQSGSVSVPLSETSGSNAQERSEKDTPSHFVPSLPSADGSIAQAKEQPPQFAIEMARQAGECSPCRSKRGVCVFDSMGVLSTGYNHKPKAFACDGSAECKANCRNEAVHAEQMALLLAGRRGYQGSLLHVKVVDGKPVASGGPSCVQCSKLIVAAGISFVWLLHEDGWRKYDSEEFHRLSLLCQSEAQQEIAKLKEEVSELGQDARRWIDDHNQLQATLRENHDLRIALRYAEAHQEAAESLAAERQQEIARLKAEANSFIEVARAAGC